MFGTMKIQFFSHPSQLFSHLCSLERGAEPVRMRSGIFSFHWNSFGATSLGSHPRPGSVGSSTQSCPWMILGTCGTWMLHADVVLWMPGWMVVEEELPENDLLSLSMRRASKKQNNAILTCRCCCMFNCYWKILKALSNKIGNGMEMNGMGLCFKL